MKLPFLSRLSFKNWLRGNKKRPHLRKRVAPKVYLSIEALEIRELMNSAPSILSVTPANGSTVNSSTPSLTVTYSERMKAPEADNAANYLLFNTTTGQQVPINSVSANDLNNNSVTSVTLHYNSNNPLPSGTYSLFVRGDQIQDVADNLFMSPPGQLLVANGGTNTASLVSIGSDGSLGAVGNYPDPVNSAAIPSLVTFANLDGVVDAHGNPIPDLVVVNQGTDQVLIFPGQAGGGYRSSPALTLALPTGANASGIVVADFNKDGLPDIAVADEGTNQVTVFLNTRPASAVGQLSFTAGANYAAGASPVGLVAADFLQNGNLDLAVANNGQDSNQDYDVSVLPGTGTGTFGAPDSIPVGTPANNFSGLTSVAEGLLDSNSFPDLVVGGSGPAGTYGVAVLLNTTSGGTLSFASPDLLANSGPAVTMPITSVAVGYIDGTQLTSTSGHPGIAATSGGNASQLLLFSNDGTGTFSQAPNIISLNAPATSVMLKDLNGDGRNDILVANDTSAAPGGVMTLLNTSTASGSVSFAAPVSYAVPGVPVSLAVGDTNQDGIPDVVTANSKSNDFSVLLGNSDGTLRLSTDISTGANSDPQAVASGDLTGTGFPSLVVADRAAGQVTIFLGTGAGTYAAPFTVAVGAAPVAVAIGDLRGNGVNDIVVANQTDNTVTVLLNNGVGTSFTAATYSVGKNPTGLALADFNGDGFIDIAVSHNGTGPGVAPGVSVLFNQQNGSFAAAREVAQGVMASAVVAGDFRQKGLADLAVANGQAAGQVLVFNNDGRGNFTQSGTYATIDDPTSLAVGDMNRDGFPDIVVGGGTSSGTTTGNLGVLLNQAGTGFGASVDTIVHDARTVIANVAVTQLGTNAYPSVVVGIASESTVNSSKKTVAVTPINNLFTLQGVGDGNFAAPHPYLAGGLAPSPSVVGIASNPLILATTFTVVSTLEQVNLISNGSFTLNNFNPAEGYLTAWNTFSEANGRGDWRGQDLGPNVNPSGISASPLSMTPIPAPPNGTAAVLDEADITFQDNFGDDPFAGGFFGGLGPDEETPIVAPGLAGIGINTDYFGTNVLYQDFVVPTSATALNLTFNLLILSDQNFTSGNSALTYTNPNPNQQVRIDLMNPNANIEDVGSGVLLNIAQTSFNGGFSTLTVAGNPPTSNPISGGYTPIQVNLTPYLSSLAGHTVRFRVAEVTNEGKVIVGLANVNMQATFNDATPPTLLNLRLRNPGSGASASSGGISSDQTLIGQVLNPVIGSPDDIASIAIDTTGTNQFTGPGTVVINSSQIDPNGNFSVDLSQAIPGGLLPGTHTVDVQATNLAGNSFETSITFTVQGPSNSAWQAQGPGPTLTAGSSTFVAYPTVSGDVQVTVSDPRDPSGNTIYIGAANGGVWKTVDGGLDWTPLTDFVFDSNGTPVPEDIGGLAIGASANLPAGQSSNVIYAATGVASYSFYAQAGVGILKSTDAGQTWSVMGENVFMGARISKVVVDPQDANTVYVAVVSGGAGPGVYKSTDGGVTWTNTTLPSNMNVAAGGTLTSNGVTNVASVTDLAINPFNPEDLLLGMGNMGFAPSSQSTGVWSSANGGGTWNQVLGGAEPNLPNDTIPAGLVPGGTAANIGRVTLAIGTGTASDAGYWYVMMSAPPLGSPAFPLGKPGIDPGDAGDTTGFLGLFKSKNFGLDWTQVQLREDIGQGNPIKHNYINVDPLMDEGNNFQALVVDPSDPNIVYLGGADRYSDQGLIFVGGPASQPFLMIDTRQMVDPTSDTFFGGNSPPRNSGDSWPEATEAWFRQTHPTFDNADGYPNPQGVGVYWVNLEYNFSGNDNLFFSGNNFFGFTQLVPSGINSLTFDSHGRLLVGTVGGVFEGINYGFNPVTTADDVIPYPKDTGLDQHAFDLGIPQFFDINGNLQIANLTSVAINPTNPNAFFTTQGDTGSSMSTGSLTWQPMISQALPNSPAFDPVVPSGAAVRVSPPNPSIPGSQATVYLTWQYAASPNFFPNQLQLQVDVSHTGGSPGSFVLQDSGIRAFSDSSGPLPILVTNPAQPGELLFGTQSLYETDTFAGTWDEISPQSGLEAGAYITAAAFAPSGTDFYYAGTNTGHIYVTTNNGADGFPQKSTGLPSNISINGITVDPNNANTAYAMIGGSGIASGGPVWKTTDAGTTWTAMSTGLPNDPAFSMAIDPTAVAGAANGRLYVGTQVGVFESNDGGQTWSLVGQGLPHAPVVDLEWDPSSKELAAAVQGRGVFTISTNVEGPYVTSSSPSTPGSSPLTSVTVNFNNPVNPTTLVIDAATTARSTEVVNGLVHSAAYFTKVVDADYQLLLNRLPNSNDPDYVSQLQGGTITDEQVIADIVGTQEYFQDTGSNNQLWFIKTYTTLVGQGPSQAQIGQAQTDLQTETRTQVATNDILATSAYQQTLINSLFTAYLQRTPTAGELATYQNLIKTGDSDEQLVAQIVSSPEFYQVNGSRQPLTPGNTPQAATLADLSGNLDANHQPIPDLIVASAGTSNNLAIYQGLATGGFATTPIVLNFPASANPVDPTSIAVGDFNGDNMPDIAVTDTANNVVDVFLNTSSNGTVSFSNGTATIAGSNPIAVLATHLDPAGSGNLDLAVADSGTDANGNYDLVLLHGSGNGTFTFNQSNVISTGLSGAPTGLAAGDLNGDGLIDLVVSSLGGLKAFFNATTTAGVYVFPASMQQLVSTSSTTSVAIGHIDTSGHNDIVATTSPTQVGSAPLNQFATSVIDFGSQFSTTAWSAAQALGPPNTFSYGDNSTAWAPLQPFGGPPEPDHISLAYTTPVFATGVVVRETFGNGFVTEVDVEDLNNVWHTVFTGIDPSQPGQPVNFPVTFPETNYLVKGVRVWSNTNHNNNNPGIWTEIDSVQLQGINPVAALPVGGHILVFQNLGGSQPTFISSAVLTAGNDPVAVTLADLLGTGVDDILVANDDSQGSISVFRNRTTHSVGLDTLTFDNPVSYAVGSNPISLALGDVNRDGVPDLVAADAASDDFWTILGNNDGSFQIPTDQSFINLAYNELTGQAPLQSVFNTLNQNLQAAEQVYLDGPHGRTVPLSITSLNPNTGGVYPYDTSFQITFAPQVADGTYTFKLGPNSLGINVEDFEGNAQDQNRNGINGENPGDIYTTQIPLATTDDSFFLTSVFQNLLGRTPTDAEFVADYAALESGRDAQLSQIATQVVTSIEARIVEIDNVYSLLLNRQATYAELYTWWTFLLNGGSREQLIANIAGTDEFFNNDAGATVDGFIGLIFQDLFDRVPTATELSNGEGQLGSNPSQATRLLYVQQLMAAPSEQLLVVSGTSGSFTLTFEGQTTTALPFSATAAQIQNALNALATIGGAGGAVTVTVPQSGIGYLINFGGALATTIVPPLTSTAKGGTTATVSFAAGAPSQQLLNVTGRPGGAFTLTFNGQTTSALTIDSSGNLPTAAQVQSALNALSSIGGAGGSVTVTVPTNGIGYLITFGGTLATSFVTPISAQTIGAATATVSLVAPLSSEFLTDEIKSLYFGLLGRFPSTTEINAALGLITSTTQASSSQQQLTLGGTLSASGQGGTFTLTFEGKSTAALKFNATAAQIQSALNALSTIGGAGGFVTVTQNANGFLITFGGALSNAILPPITAAGAGLTTASVAIVNPNAYEQLEISLLASPEFFLRQQDKFDGLATNNAWLTAVYAKIRNQPPEQSFLGFYNALGAGYAAQRSQLAANLLASTEYDRDLVNGYFSQFLLGVPTAAQLATYVGLLQSGTAPETVIADLLSSNQFFTQVANSSNSQWVAQVYHLLLNSSNPPQQLINLLNSNQITLLQAALSVVYGTPVGTFNPGTLYLSQLVTGYYTSFLGRRPSPTELNGWISGLQAGSQSDQSLITTLLSSQEYFNHINGFQAPTSNAVSVALPYGPDPFATTANLDLSSSWTDDVVGDIITVNGQAVGDGSGNTNVAVLNGINATDVRLSAQASLAGSQTVGLVARYTNASSMYVGMVSLNNAGQVTGQILLGNTPIGLSFVTPLGTTPGTVEFDVINTQLTLSWNGVTVASVTDSNLLSGSVGIEVGPMSGLTNFGATAPMSFVMDRSTKLVHIGPLNVPLTNIQDPAQLPINFSAAIYPELPYQAFTFRQEFGLIFLGSYYQNSLGLNEKQLFGTVTNMYYVIQPDGTFSVWNGGHSITTLGVFDPSYWADPSKLWNAQQPINLSNNTNIANPMTVSFTNNPDSPVPAYQNVNLSITPNNNVGFFTVVVTADDTIQTDTQSFVMDAQDQAPSFTLQAAASVAHGAGQLTVPINNISDADNDPVNLSAAVYNYLPALAYQLQQQYGLTFTGTFYQNQDGFNEKWLFGTVTNSWYFIQPNGTVRAANLQVIGILDPTYWANPSTLYNAQAPTPVGTITPSITPSSITPTVANPYPLTASMTLTLNTSNLSGSYMVSVSVTDTNKATGATGLTTTHNMQLNIIETAPTFTVPTSPVSVVHTAGTTGALSPTITQISDAEGDTTTFPAHPPVYSYLPELAFQLQQQLGLTFTGNFFQNQNGYNERWLFGTVTNKWYFIQPNGTFRASNLQVLGIFDPSYWTNPALLYNATQPAPVNTVTATMSPNTFNAPYPKAGDSGTLSFNWNPQTVAGSFVAVLSATDNILTSPSQNVVVNITDTAPQFTLQATKSVQHGAGSTTVTVTGISDAEGDAVNFPANPPVYAYLPELAFLTQQQLGLSFNTSFYQNQNGLNEKWLFGTVTNSWYYITPAGGLFTSRGTLIATFDSTYWQTPATLYQAAQPAPVGTVTATMQSTQPSGTTDQMTLNWSPNSVVGSFMVALNANDGILTSATQFMRLDLTDTAPTFTLPASQSFPHAGGSATVNVTNISPAAGDTVTIPNPTIYAYLPELAFLTQQKYGLTFKKSFYQNSLGFNEKWLFGTVTGQWYVIKPDGTFYQVGSDGSSLTLITTFDNTYWQNPTTLYQATQPPPVNTVTATMGSNNPSGSTDPINLSWNGASVSGSFMVVVTASSQFGMSTTAYMQLILS